MYWFVDWILVYLADWGTASAHLSERGEGYGLVVSQRITIAYRSLPQKQHLCSDDLDLLWFPLRYRNSEVE
jgi:hypothetical protein